MLDSKLRMLSIVFFLAVAVTLCHDMVKAQEQSSENTHAVQSLILRSSARKELSTNDVILMIKRYDFFCSDDQSTLLDRWNNPNSRGFANDFQKINNQVVVDRATRLMWQRSGSKMLINFENAIALVKILNQKKYQGFADWRLPTLEEAMSLTEPNKQTNFQGTVLVGTTMALHIDPIFDNQLTIWTVDGLDRGDAWAVSFVSGTCIRQRKDYTLFLRVVRSIKGNDEEKLSQLEEGYFKTRTKYEFLLNYFRGVTTTDGRGIDEAISNLKKLYSRAKMGDPQAASEIDVVLEKMLKIYPMDLPVAQYNLGILYTDLHDLERAAEWFDKAAKQGFMPAKTELEKIKRTSK